jgi:phosphohistidine phosphatase
VADEVGTERYLIVLRHAKSDWPEGVPDHARPLAKRGRREAPLAGRWLRRHGYLPDVVLCSTARRTRETWALVQDAMLDGGDDIEDGDGAGRLAEPMTVTFEPRAYAASEHTLLYLVRELPLGCRTALLIAHNPGVSELATALTEEAEEAEEAQETKEPQETDEADDSAQAREGEGGGSAEAACEGPNRGTTRRLIGFPTTGLAVLSFGGDWADLAPGAARLAAFVRPADM